MIIAVEPTKLGRAKGCTAAIEVRGTIFNLRTCFDAETNFTHIDISDSEGNFIDEFASGFGIDLNDDPESLEYNSIKVFEYIDENLVF